MSYRNSRTQTTPAKPGSLWAAPEETQFGRTRPFLLFSLAAIAHCRDKVFDFPGASVYEPCLS